MENDYWPDLEYYPTKLVENAHSLRRIPICELDVKDIRFLIGQNIGVKYLVPIALNILEADILVDAFYYPGDLLMARLLKLQEEYWKESPAERARLVYLLRKSKEMLSDTELIDEETRIDLAGTVNDFLNKGNLDDDRQHQ